MILKYGSYAHENDEVAINGMSTIGVPNPSGVITSYRHTWRITGRLQADTQAALTTAILALQAAYSKPNQNLILYLDDGVTETAHALKSAGAINGVRVTDLSYPQGDGAEYSTWRSYEISVEAEYPASNTASELLEFEQTIVATGGGPRRAAVETLDGPPQIQILNRYTTYRVRQTGRAVARFGYPTARGPLFPANLEEGPTTSISSPLSFAAPGYGFGVTWDYSFISATPLVASSSSLWR